MTYGSDVFLSAGLNNLEVRYGGQDTGSWSQFSSGVGLRHTFEYGKLEIRPWVEIGYTMFFNQETKPSLHEALSYRHFQILGSHRIWDGYSYGISGGPYGEFGIGMGYVLWKNFSIEASAGYKFLKVKESITGWDDRYGPDIKYGFWETFEYINLGGPTMSVGITYNF